ncbi:hypothetical protein [Anaerotignum sp.]|uniref:hypothetical protein n=1 Tax=Anaerotignum sp. TaxID=2039241 RepID=UPI00289C63B3|nr:hypothetical protein [Anaerotignum sp.]
MEIKDIKFVEEKKWIMLYYMKRTYGKKSPNQLNYTRMLQMYQHWWNEDLHIDGKKYRKIIAGKKQVRLPVSGIVIDEEYQKYFDNMYEELSSLYQTMNVDQIKEKRMAARNKKRIPLSIRELANEVGYQVQQGSAKYHPYKLTGYQIIHTKGKNKVAGLKFELTLDDVKKWLRNKKRKLELSNN